MKGDVVDVEDVGLADAGQVLDRGLGDSMR